jgi:hypothetical protein
MEVRDEMDLVFPIAVPRSMPPAPRAALSRVAITRGDKG